MPKTYNNKSKNFTDWTTSHLYSELTAYDQEIDAGVSMGTKDMQNHLNIKYELATRGEGTTK